jgi:hypothetical protein
LREADLFPVNIPSLPKNYYQERAGINSVAMALARLNVIWRENSFLDVGIDGQLEYVSPEGKVTGRLVAAQVKSGRSYFHDHGSHWHFYPEDKHRFYWERFPIPVILFLHNPDSRIVYWCDARQWLRNPETSKHAYIAIPKKQLLDNATAEELFTATGASADLFLSIPDVLDRMIQARCQNPAFPVTYFELFVHGLTNICRTLYFHTEVAVNVAEFNMQRTHASVGLGMGSEEHEFLFSYLRFVVSQHLADVDYADCLIDWFDRQMQPRFFAPLTSRGRELVSLIGEHETRLRAIGRIKRYTEYPEYFECVHVAQEALIGVQMTPGTMARFPLVAQFIDAFPVAGETK